jgi:hypothetical protein
MIDEPLDMEQSLFTQQDIQQFEERGLTPEQVEAQLALFRKGFPFAEIRRPATPGDGILVLDETQRKRYERLYETEKSNFRIVKFVPASGAASRMFKSLFAYYEAWSRGGRKRGMPVPEGEMDRFFGGLERFAFYDQLEKYLVEKYQAPVQEMMSTGRYGEILDTLLFQPGLGYGTLPKGLILFHRYPEGSRTAFEEHLAEGALYAASGEGEVSLHFTVSPEHMDAFRSRLEDVEKYFEERFNARYHVTYSVQKPATDTVAVTPANEPFRKEDGTILFRPGGHGALIENLNDLEEDLVFIKNIDNVVPDYLKGDTVEYKKILGGLLLDIRNHIYHWLDKMDAGRLTPAELGEAVSFAEKQLMLPMTKDFKALPAAEKEKILYKLFHRPVRVCGMVKNEGELGGGPFWVAGEEGRLSLQIVESAQIDLSDPVKKKLVRQSTHFNPVDLVCAVRDHKGKKYDLREFVDPDTFFISEKSYDGKELKALELPGLWNGSMARWTTLFIEVPPATFNPVKTVLDLLRPQHQEA